jgi:hypothetical protein
MLYYNLGPDQLFVLVEGNPIVILVVIKNLYYCVLLYAQYLLVVIEGGRDCWDLSSGGEYI